MIHILDILLQLIHDILITKKRKQKVPFCPENKFIPKEKNNDYMKTIKPKNNTKTKKLICGWTQK